MCVNVVFLHFGSYLRLQKEAREDVFVFWAEKDIKRRANSSPFYTHDIVWWKAGFYTRNKMMQLFVYTCSWVIKNNKLQKDTMSYCNFNINSEKFANRAL